MIIRAAQLGASMFQRNIVYSQNSPGLGLGRVRSCTMCSWYLPFPFCRTILQKRKQISNKKLSSSNNSCNFGSNSCFLLKKRACEGGCQGAHAYIYHWIRKCAVWATHPPTHPPTHHPPTHPPSHPPTRGPLEGKKILTKQMLCVGFVGCWWVLKCFTGFFCYIITGAFTKFAIFENRIFS